MDPKKLSFSYCKLRQKVVVSCGNYFWSTKRFYRDRYGGLPVRIFSEGTREWCRKNYLHSTDDLPARIWSDGKKEWYRSGKLNRNHDRPTVVSRNGQEWWCENLRHRSGNKPAVIYKYAPPQYWWHGTRYQPKTR